MFGWAGRVAMIIRHDAGDWQSRSPSERNKESQAGAVAVILKARQPARIMTAIGDKAANRWHLQMAERWVVHSNFYVNDRDWGGCSCASALTFHSCPYPPQ